MYSHTAKGFPYSDAGLSARTLQTTQLDEKNLWQEDTRFERIKLIYTYIFLYANKCNLKIQSLWSEPETRASCQLSC